MRIGIDARELAGHPTGVGRYLAQLLAQWARLPEARPHEFLLYAPARERGAAAAAVPDGLPAAVRPVPGGRGSWWEQVRLPRAARADRLDVFFAPAYSAPLRLDTPVVLTIHDLSFLAHPEWFRPRERLRRAWFTRQSARRARLVLTDSAFSRDEILRHLAVQPARVHVIPLGVGVTPATRESGEGLGRPGTPREPLVLFVGSIFNRRRLPDLISAFAQVAPSRPAARLEIVGDDRTWPPQDLAACARDEGVAERVGLRSYVPDEVLRDLYRRASVFVFLSEYEGFGLTPLEALGHGVPIVVLDTAIAREVYGPAAIYVQAGDIAGTAAVLATLLDRAEARRDALAPAPAVLARYRWDEAARATLGRLLSAPGDPERA